MIDEIKQKLKLLIESGYPCIALTTHEENRALEFLDGIARKMNRRLYSWSLSKGWCRDDEVVDLKTDRIPVVAEGKENQSLVDLSGREITVLVPIIVLIVLIGVYPGAFLRKMEPSVNQLIKTVEIKMARGLEGEKSLARKP